MRARKAWESYRQPSCPTNGMNRGAIEGTGILHGTFMMDGQKRRFRHRFTRDAMYGSIDSIVIVP